MKQKFKKQLQNYLTCHFPVTGAATIRKKAPKETSRILKEAINTKVKPCKYQYLGNILKKEFTRDYLQFREHSSLTRAITDLIWACEPIFSTMHFSGQKLNEQLIGYAVCRQIYQYLNSDNTLTQAS